MGKNGCSDVIGGNLLQSLMGKMAALMLLVETYCKGLWEEWQLLLAPLLGASLHTTILSLEWKSTMVEEPPTADSERRPAANEAAAPPPRPAAHKPPRPSQVLPGAHLSVTAAASSQSFLLRFGARSGRERARPSRDRPALEGRGRAGGSHAPAVSGVPGRQSAR